MRVDDQTCPVCDRPRSEHDPGCRYEDTLIAAQERFSEARSDLGRTLLQAVHDDWPLLLLLFAGL
jgi:hypothetical protein